MKKAFTVLAALSIVCSLSAQSLKDIFKGIGNSSAVKDIIETVTGTTIKENIIGTWVYTGSAIGLESDNLLTELAGNAATGTVTDKIDTYLSKAGIKKGTFSFTFKEDGTFTVTLKKKSVSGTYTIADDNKGISLKYGQQMQWMSMTGTATILSSKLTLLFDADKMMGFINTIAQVAGTFDSTIGALATMLSQYEGMDAGFTLTKK